MEDRTELIERILDRAVEASLQVAHDLGVHYPDDVMSLDEAAAYDQRERRSSGSPHIFTRIVREVGTLAGNSPLRSQFQATMRDLASELADLDGSKSRLLCAATGQDTRVIYESVQKQGLLDHRGLLDTYRADAVYEFGAPTEIDDD